MISLHVHAPPTTQDETLLAASRPPGPALENSDPITSQVDEANHAKGSHRYVETVGAELPYSVERRSASAGRHSQGFQVRCIKADQTSPPLRTLTGTN